TRNRISRSRLPGGPAGAAEPAGASATFLTISSMTDLLRAQALEDLNGPGRLRSPRVVRVGVDRANDTLTIDDESGRNGESPGSITVALGQVDSELQVDLAQVVGQREDEAVGLPHAVAEIAQRLERQRLGLLGLARRARHLRRDDGKRGAGGGDLG